MVETIFQNEILANFVYPFLLVFFIVFAVLEKTKLFGEGKKQLNALLSLVIGLVFIGAVRPKIIVGNLIMFLSMTIVIIFIVLLLWGFIFWSKEQKEGFQPGKWMRRALGALVTLAIFIAVLWATGLNTGVGNFFFKQEWSNMFWTNFPFIVVVAIVLALLLKPKGGGEEGKGK